MIECKSEKEKYRCSTEINGYTITSDATIDKGGQEKGDRPHDILVTAFASCLNMSIRMACNKIQIPIDLVTTKVGLMREDTKIVFTYQIDFNDEITEDLKNEILRMVENCTVRKTLSKPIEFHLIKV